jgi:hypothetical protein
LKEHNFSLTSTGGSTLILRLTCPGCSKDSYSPSVESFKPCPYCGLLFSAKYGTEKRNDVRQRKEIPFLFSYKGQNLQASTVNLSESGLSVKIFGRPALPVGDVMELRLGDAVVKAEVLWVFDLHESGIALTGLKVLDGNIDLLKL